MGTHRVLTRYSRVLIRYCATPPSTRHSFECLSQYLWDAAGSARQCGAPERRVRAAWHCRVLTGYSSILTGYSRVLTSTNTVLRTPRSGRGPTSHKAWQRVAPLRAAALRVWSNIGVLTRYSGVLPRYAYCAPRHVHEPPSRSCCSICGTHSAVHGRPGHIRVWFVW